jgi:hypothetical protein
MMGEKLWLPGVIIRFTLFNRGVDRKYSPVATRTPHLEDFVRFSLVMGLSQWDSHEDHLDKFPYTDESRMPRYK